MKEIAGYTVLTLAGSSADNIGSDGPVVLYGYAVTSSDADFQVYDGLAAYTAGTTTVLFHRTATGTLINFVKPIQFTKGIYIDGSANTVISLFYKIDK